LQRQFRHLVTGVLLLSSDEVAVAHGERLKRRRRDKVCPKLPRLVLNAEGNDLLADDLVGEILLAVGEAGRVLAANDG
jgi:hypothetical protein